MEMERGGWEGLKHNSEVELLHFQTLRVDASSLADQITLLGLEEEKETREEDVLFTLRSVIK